MSLMSQLSMTFTGTGKTSSIHIYGYRTWVYAVQEGNEKIGGNKGRARK